MALTIAGVKRKLSDVGLDVSRTLAPQVQLDLNFRSSLFARQQSHNVSRSQNASPVSSAVQRVASVSRVFPAYASIVLIGTRGSGKSSLAVIACTALGRRLIDTDRSFQEITGYSCSAYMKAFGTKDYQQRHAQVLGSVLTTNQSGCVIVCSSSSLDTDSKNLLQEYSKNHPVVHVIRDVKSIQEYLKITDQDKMSYLLEISETIFRGCSNLEFYNLTERSPDHASSFSNRSYDAGDGHWNAKFPSTPFLTLKRTEKDFVRFLNSALSLELKTAPETAYPLSKLPVEQRLYTYVISVSLSALLANKVDIVELEVGADAFELRIDNIDNSFQMPLTSAMLDRISRVFATIRRKTIIPMIYHVDMDTFLSTRGTWMNQELYLELVRHGLHLMPEYATIDLACSDGSIGQLLVEKGQTKIIGHHHDPETEPGWRDPKFFNKYRRARSLGCDIVRVSRPASSMDDNFAIHSFNDQVRALPEPHPPLVAYNTGRLGRVSACFNQTMTPVTHSALADVRKAEAMPCITAHEATTALYSAFVLEPMRFYIYGASVAYSLSPAMHNGAYRACGLPHTYHIKQSASLAALQHLVEDPNFGGAAIAQPFKTEVVALIHSMSPHAEAIGAVNSLIPVRNLLPDGSIANELGLCRERSRSGPVKALYGENTDWIGVRACIQRGLSPVNAVGLRTTGLVIGAGGMARASVYAMIQLGVKHIFVWNRTLAHAERLAVHYNSKGSPKTTPYGSRHATPSAINNHGGKATVHVLRSLEDPWPEQHRPPTMVVSCISPQSNPGNVAAEFTMPLQWLRSPTGGVVVELAYHPLVTALVRQIRAEAHRGWVAMDGLDVLPEQGFAQFELFTGRRAPRRLMQREVLQNFVGEAGQYDPESIQARLNDIE